MLRAQCTFVRHLVLASPRGGVCVCVTLGIIGILLDLSGLFFRFVSQQGGNEHFGRHCPTKTLPSCCDIPEGRLGNVPAIFLFRMARGKAENLTTRCCLGIWFTFCRCARVAVTLFDSLAVFDLELLASLLLTDLQVL